MYIVPRVIAAFKRRHPNIKLQLSVKDTRQVEEDVLSNESDFGFVGGHLIGADIEIITWRSDELLLISHPENPLTKRIGLTLKDLKQEPFIFRERGSATQSILEQHLQQAKMRVETALELSNPEAVKQAVRNGLGIAFISKFAVHDEIKAKMLRVLKVEGLDISRELKIVYRKDKHLSHASRAFIEMAKKDVT